MTEKENKDLKVLEVNASEISEELINPTYTNIDVIENYLKTNFDIETINVKEFIEYLVSQVEVDIAVYVGRKLKGLPINKEDNKNE